jgi:hypothetical protein
MPYMTTVRLRVASVVHMEGGADRAGSRSGEWVFAADPAQLPSGAGARLQRRDDRVSLPHSFQDLNAFVSAMDRIEADFARSFDAISGADDRSGWDSDA